MRLRSWAAACPLGQLVVWKLTFNPASIGVALGATMRLAAAVPDSYCKREKKSDREGRAKPTDSAAAQEAKVFKCSACLRLAVFQGRQPLAAMANSLLSRPWTRRTGFKPPVGSAMAKAALSSFGPHFAQLLFIVSDLR